MVDIQERLVPAIVDRERMVAEAVRLVRGARALGVPVFATEQNRKGIGATVSEVAEAIPAFAPFDKLTFSACGVPEFVGALRAGAIRDVLLCGIETHVCVCQTALDLIGLGFRPFVVADAVSSRTAENRRLGIDRMRQAGVTIVSTEMALFELLERAGTDDFRSILRLVR